MSNDCSPDVVRGTSIIWLGDSVTVRPGRHDHLIGAHHFAAAVIPIAAPLTVAFPPDNASYNTFSALHGLNGTLLIPSTILILILLSFTARHPWKTTLLTALLLLLLILQFALALIGFQHSELAPIVGLHGLNALLLVGLTLRLTWQRWAF